jgi:hypothetical protein
MPRIQITVCDAVYDIIKKKAEKNNMSVNHVVNIILNDALRLKQNILEN